MKLKPEEPELTGKWEMVNGRVRGDATSERIQWLTTTHLQEVAISKESGGWETLFKDPDDGRYWERTFPHGDWQGGGPPRLALLSVEEAQSKYEL
jgi:hypothetical protein